jgi:transcriptional regulator with XRE-family HTH domain
MVRPPLSQVEHARGARLGTLLREARGTRSMAEIAAASGVPAETLRKIETGRIATPAFFTVAALAGALGLSLEDIARRCAPPAAAGARGGRAPGSKARDGGAG